MQRRKAITTRGRLRVVGVLSCTALAFLVMARGYGLDIEPIKRSDYRADASRFSPLAEWIPYAFVGDTVYRFEPAVGSSPEVVFRADYPLLDLSYNESLGLIAYVYGTGEFSAPALYDLRTRTGKVLRDLAYDDSGAVFYQVFRSIDWASSDTLVYTVYNHRSGSTEVWFYDVDAARRSLGTSGQDAQVDGVDAASGRLIVSMGARERTFYTASVGDLRWASVPILGADRVLVLGNDRFLGFTQQRSADGLTVSLVTIYGSTGARLLEESFKGLLGPTDNSLKGCDFVGMVKTGEGQTSRQLVVYRIKP